VAYADASAGGPAAGFETAGSRLPVCSTTRVKSAIVFSLMVDGSGSLGCRICGRLRPEARVRRSRQQDHGAVS
jgi:hypothetical protein